MSERVLIVKPSSLGDIIHSLPVLNALYRTGRYLIDWVVASGFEGLLQGHPMINRLWIIDKHTWKGPTGVVRFLKDLSGLRKRLQAQQYSVVIDLQGLFRSGAITWLSGAPVRIGFSNAREGSPLFYNRKLYVERQLHAVHRYLRLLELLNIETGDVVFPLVVSEPSDRVVPEGSYFVIVPGARWKTKTWPAEYFGQTIRMITEAVPRLIPVIVGSASDRSVAERVKAASKIKCIDLTGETSLAMLADIIKNALFVISNDSGPMHLASALDVPVIAIFGPTNEQMTGPYGQLDNVVKAEVSCRPCFKKHCEHLSCMYQVRPEDVIKKLKDIISIFN